MRASNIILNIGLAGLVSLSGYLLYSDTQKHKEEGKKLETIIGYPLSVQQEGNYMSSRLSTMIRDRNGKNILCQARLSSGIGLPINDSASILESEMNDGDNEPVELKGMYHGNIFEIWSVSANGYTISGN